jgi:hypothetical protein
VDASLDQPDPDRRAPDRPAPDRPAPDRPAPDRPERGDRRLWAELLRRTRRDQELRRRRAAGPNAVHDRHPTAEHTAEQAAVDADNSAWLVGVVALHGWPGRSLVGEDGAMAAWMLAQHAEAFPDRQRTLLAALSRAVADGEASPAQLAYLEDRVRVGEGRPQRYGTQYLVTADGARTPFPVEDPAGLDARRAAAGLPPTVP